MAENGSKQHSTTQAPAGNAGATVASSFATVLGVIVVAFIAAAPFTWALMLFLGNLGLAEMGYWACLPGGALIGVLAGAARGAGK